MLGRDGGMLMVLIIKNLLLCRWAGVNKANAQDNPLAVLPSFSKFKKDGLNLTLETKR